MTTGPNDEKFLGGMPGRLLGNQGQKSQLAKEPSMADKVMKRVDDMAEIQLAGDMVAKVLNKGGGGETLAASIVTHAMDMQTNALKMMQENQKTLEEQRLKAQQNRDETVEKAQGQREENLKDVLKTLNETIKTVQAGGDPKKAASILGEVETVMGWLQARTLPEAASAKAQPGVSEELQIKILESRNLHELEMKKLDLQIADVTNKFQLQLKQFEEDSRRRWHEYDSGQKTREKGLEGFQDLAGAIAAGIRGERNSAAAVEHESPAPGGEAIQAAIKTFPCQFCKMPVQIKPGELKAVCDNPVCKAEYDIKSA